MPNIEERLRQDLKDLGLPVDFNMNVRGYSKSYNGRYDPNTSTIILYVLEEDGSQIEYSHILGVAIHENVHHYQWKHDPTFKRFRGVMHSAKFKALEKKYRDLAIQRGMVAEWDS